MEIRFTTKEESKALQEEEFLALSPSERVLHFFLFSKKILELSKERPEVNKNNFILEK